MVRTILVVFALALVAAVAACGGTSSAENATPAPAASSAPGGTAVSPTAGGGGGAATAVGKQVFAQNCAGCHKADGSGGYGPDIRGITDAALVQQQVTNGGAKMPAFKGQLSSAQIKAVAQFVVTGL